MAKRINTTLNLNVIKLFRWLWQMIVSCTNSIPIRVLLSEDQFTPFLVKYNRLCKVFRFRICCALDQKSRVRKTKVGIGKYNYIYLTKRTCTTDLIVDNKIVIDRRVRTGLVESSLSRWSGFIPFFPIPKRSILFLTHHCRFQLIMSYILFTLL